LLSKPRLITISNRVINACRTYIWVWPNLLQQYILHNKVAKCWQSWIHVLKNNLCCLSHLIIWHILLINFGSNVFMLFLNCVLSFSLLNFKLSLSFYNFFPSLMVHFKLCLSTYLCPYCFPSTQLWAPMDNTIECTLTEKMCKHKIYHLPLLNTLPTWIPTFAYFPPKLPTIKPTSHRYIQLCWHHHYCGDHPRKGNKVTISRSVSKESNHMNFAKKTFENKWKPRTLGLWKNDSIMALKKSLVKKWLRFFNQFFTKPFIISCYTRYLVIIWNLELKISLIFKMLF
jgi:hypothetical protein